MRLNQCKNILLETLQDRVLMALPSNFQTQYKENGLFFVENFFSSIVVNQLSEICDQLMLGTRKLDGMFFQLDPNSSDYGKVTFENTSWSGPNLNYRKVKDLEFVPEFLRAIQESPASIIGKSFIGNEVSSMRTMIVSKPPGSATPLPWHQDISENWPMSGCAELTIWIALDEVDESNGCVEWVKGSHKLDKIDSGHLASEDSVKNIVREDNVVKGILKKGSAVVFHNAVLHRSQPNLSNKRRRGLTICLMNADIYNTKSKTYYPKIFGTNALNEQGVSTLLKVPEGIPVSF